MNRRPVILWMVILLLVGRVTYASDSLRLENRHLRLVWAHTAKGWEIARAQVHVGGRWLNAGTPSGEYTLLYANGKPVDTVREVFRTHAGTAWPDTAYKYQINSWKEATSPVAMNTAGQAIYFYPSKAAASGRKLVFTQETEIAAITAEWSLDTAFGSDVIVRQTLTPKTPGYFSLATPSLASINENDLSWATVPGYFQGSKVQPDFVLAYAYGQGIPGRPVIYRERCAASLSPIIGSRRGFSFSVIPDPGLARNPWAHDQNTHRDWLIGLSHMDRRSQFSPTLYFPVLGEPSSALIPGQAISFGFRYSLQEGDWYRSLQHTINDIYHFTDALALRHNQHSLTTRMEGMLDYLSDRRTAMWNLEEYQGMTIGAQSYLGGVVGSQRDAMKNSDYGAMWMVGAISGSPWFADSILPYARNFKLVQQQTDTGFFQGAAIGQYYLAKRKKFVEEWGEFVEPVSLTYYTMLDLGNILLFEPENAGLRQRLRLGAETLLRWQRPDGSWDVAYDRHTHRPLFTDLKDLRPTFYGLLVAYRILKDERYLTAARKGADWLIREGVGPGHFIGVCGDARYAPDFATGQTAQCLLDLYDLTHASRYKEAAIRTARFYTASVYTQPMASHEARTVRGRPREDWEISQSGLSFEHGGIIGSANGAGPILLCSHAGLFIRIFRMTGDSLFAVMARAAAIGRDAFVDSATSVASYYWNAMNKGAGPYPHHAWWQIGWITDYLMAEAELRSGGKIVFPRGFVTPKVGPHESYGFAPGVIAGQPARLVERTGLVIQENPDMEIITAVATDRRRLFVVLMNDRKDVMQTEIRLNMDKLETGKHYRVVKVSGMGGVSRWQAKLGAYGIGIWTVDYE
ncbi:MAG TPA: hypothetical protein VL832_01070 [Puia sp.]|nr:hypothetical protein [Puia sp.]